MTSTRQPGRHKRGRGVEHISWFDGITVNGRYLPPIGGAESNPPAGDEAGDRPGGEGNGPPGEKPKPDADGPKFTQAQVDALITDRLAREKRKADEAADKARREAEERAAAEQGEFKKLADQRQERITALEAQAAEVEVQKARADKAEAALTAILDAQRKDLPEHILELLEGRDPADQLSYLAKNAEKLGLAGAARPGVPANPRASAVTPDQKVAEARKELAQTGNYSRF